MGEHPQQIDQLLEYVFSYGPFWVYAALFLACFIENIAPPFPGDSFIVAAGGLVAADRLDLTLAYWLAVVGGMLSVMVWYGFGKRYGRDYLIRKDFKFFSANDIYKSEALFARWGPIILVVSRFVVGFRVAIALTAGMGKVKPIPMLVFSTVSYMLFVGLLMYLGYVAVENLDLIEHYITTYKTIAWPLVIALVLIWAVRKFQRVRKNRSS